MHPVILKMLAAEHVRDMRARPIRHDNAAACRSRRAVEARRLANRLRGTKGQAGTDGFRSMLLILRNR